MRFPQAGAHSREQLQHRLQTPPTAEMIAASNSSGRRRHYTADDLQDAEIIDQYQSSTRPIPAPNEANDSMHQQQHRGVAGGGGGMPPHRLPQLPPQHQHQHQHYHHGAKQQQYGDGSSGADNGYGTGGYQQQQQLEENVGALRTAKMVDRLTPAQCKHLLMAAAKDGFIGEGFLRQFSAGFM